MHQAVNTHNTIRRKFLAGIAALPLLASGTCPVEAATVPDAALLRYCSAYHAIAAEISALGYDRTDSQMDNLVGKQWEIMKRIEACPATTLAASQGKSECNTGLFT